MITSLVIPHKVLSQGPGVPGCCTLDPGENGEMEVISLVPEGTGGGKTLQIRAIGNSTRTRGSL